MRINKFSFMHILHISILNELDKTRLRESYKFKCDYKNLIPIWENKEKRTKKIQFLNQKSKILYI